MLEEAVQGRQAESRRAVFARVHTRIKTIDKTQKILLR